MESNLPEQGDRSARQPGYGTLIALVAAWLSVMLVVFGITGALRASPADMPMGAIWVNAHAAGSPSFFIVQDGQRLILERDKHSLLLHDAMVYFAWALLSFAGVLLLLGKLKNQPGWVMSNPVPRSVAAVLIILVVNWWAYSETAYLIKGERLVLDPVADVVSNNGVVLDQFRNLSAFQAKMIHGKLTSYSISMQFRDRPESDFGGFDVGSDVIPLADDLNERIHAMRAGN